MSLAKPAADWSHVTGKRHIRRFVSESLGHSTIAITLDLYSPVMPGKQSEVAEQVSAMIFGA